MKQCLEKLPPQASDCGVGKALDALFDADANITDVLRSKVNETITDPVDEAMALKLAETIGKALDHEDLRTGAQSGEKGDTRASLLGARRRKAHDPDDQPEIWLKSGGPLGVKRHPEDRSIFPKKHEGNPDIVADVDVSTGRCTDSRLTVAFLWLAEAAMEPLVGPSMNLPSAIAHRCGEGPTYRRSDGLTCFCILAVTTSCSVASHRCRG